MFAVVAAGAVATAAAIAGLGTDRVTNIVVTSRYCW